MRRWSGFQLRSIKGIKRKRLITLGYLKSGLIDLFFNQGFTRARSVLYQSFPWLSSKKIGLALLKSKRVCFLKKLFAMRKVVLEVKFLHRAQEIPDVIGKNFLQNK